MAASPQYLAPSARTPEYTDIDPRLTGLPDGSCTSVPPSTVAYSHPDQTPYSEVSQISPFGTSPVVDDNLLTPVSSAASPELQQRDCRQSPFQQEEPTRCSQQPTPPHTTTAMYSYQDYIHSASQATSSMPLQATAAESSHDLMPYLHHSPGHEEPPPPPQSAPYYGAYSVSVPPETTDRYYLQNATIDGPMRLLQAEVNGGSYTHRPLAPLGHAAPMSTLLSPSNVQPYRREFQVPLPRLSPTHSRHASIPPRRGSERKARVRRNRRESTSPPIQQPVRFGEEVVAAVDDGPDEEVTLDDKTPADLRRLWDVRQKWLGKKGNGMWEDIMVEYHGDGQLSENKKTQVKAALQMKIHRMLLKHGKWPNRDESALLRAYKRWEENRYSEILRLYEEEMTGRKKAYEWKSQHVEAQLVKMGLEAPERDRDSKARKRKQVAARHQARAGAAQLHGTGTTPQPYRLPGTFEGPYGGHHYVAHASHYDQGAASYEAELAALGAQPPVLTEEQHNRLVNEIFEHNPFEAPPEDSDDADVKMSDYSQRSGEGLHPRSRAPSNASLMPINGMMPLSAAPVQQIQQPLTAASSPDMNAQRNKAVARRACGEILKQQSYESGAAA